MQWFNQLYLKLGVGVVALVAFLLFSVAATLLLGRFERVMQSFSRRKLRPTESGSPETDAIAVRRGDVETVPVETEKFGGTPADQGGIATFFPIRPSSPSPRLVAPESALGELSEVGGAIITSGDKLQKPSEDESH
jgi:hypothetical protein